MKLYRYDFSPPFYRWFVVTVKEPSLSIPFKFEVPIIDSTVKCFKEILAEVHAGLFSSFLNTVAERDAATSQRNVALVERDTAMAHVKTMHNSRSWHITRLLRAIARMLRYGQF